MFEEGLRQLVGFVARTMSPRLIASALIVLLNVKVAVAQVFTVSPAAAILDFGTSYFDLMVTELSTPLDSMFGIEATCIDISHKFVGQLTVWLVSPDGTDVLLTAKNGGSGDNYANTCFDGDQSNPSIASGVVPFTGTYFPEEPLGDLNSGNINPNGTWQLKITDDSALFEGILNYFSLRFGSNPASSPPILADGFE